MRKRIIALTTLVFFLVFSCSCSFYSWEKTSLDSIKPERKEGLKISQAQTKSGESIEFSKKPPTQISGDFIKGEKLLRKVEIPKNEIVNIIGVRDTHPYSLEEWDQKLITTKSGTIYRAISIKEKADHLICDAYVPISISLSDVINVWQEKFSLARIVSGALAVTIACMIFALVIILLDKPKFSLWGSAWGSILR